MVLWIRSFVPRRTINATINFDILRDFITISIISCRSLCVARQIVSSLRATKKRNLNGETTKASSHIENRGKSMALVHYTQSNNKFKKIKTQRRRRRQMCVR